MHRDIHGGFNVHPGNSSRDAEKPEQEVSTTITIHNPEDLDSLYYDMSKKKYLHIFNHFEFIKEPEVFGSEKPPSDRRGTHDDVEELKSTFDALGFKVKIHEDLSHKQIKKAIENLIDKDHSQTSCVALAILTHGRNNGFLLAKDKPYELKEITKLLETHTLATIPKLLFIQACRGHEMDEGHHVEVDGFLKKLVHVPSNIDFLILYSTVEGYVSYRHPLDGSWMMQSLCKVIQKYHSQLDILQLTTLVNKRVAYDYPKKNDINNKQTLEARYTLTKFLKLSD